ncbi:hypothetical protein P280DRAFT_468980 [Massarina eburnea CBS 473.64]|uniref:Uncharacterized protein n=1 Tax=Massarina eburnea CBS 473.64 TaxID=1395130 RepID=A0A6A6S4K5_9PLEO|nr:hypothetical protein P280DRAFT_468980 [Massarina eburnea CBS 473.64]
MDLDDQKHERSRLSHGFDTVQAFRLPVWAVAATISILSSRYLLIELNVHYPLHLHLLQLAVTGAITAADYLQQDPSYSTPSLRRTSWRKWLPFAVIAAVMATATVCSIQAILHSQNLPTLIMLAVVSPCAEAIVHLIRAPSPRSRLEMARVTIAALGCAGILLGEYRLLVPALQSAIPAMLLAGAARAYRSITVDQSTSITCDSQRMRILFCTFGLAITGLWAHSRDDESWVLFFHSIRIQHVPLLIVNCVATAIALLLGQSILLPLDDVTNDTKDAENDNSIFEMLALATMVGTIGIWSTLVLRRSYMSWTQFSFFLLVVAFTAGKFILIKRREQRKVYSVVPNGIGSHYAQHDDIDFAESSESMHLSDYPTQQPNLFRRTSSIILFIIIPLIWTGYLSLNFSERIHQTVVKMPPILDLGYTPTTDIELVISMYKERVDEVARLISTIKDMPKLREASVHIYAKDNTADTDWIRMGTGANHVTMIPNIGREGETYLHHIIHNWDTLARHTVFLQADVHNPREFYRHIKNYFDPARTGMLNLGWRGQVCNCDACGDRFRFEDTTHLFPSLQAQINNATACEKVLLSYKGQFIASAKRIRGVKKAVYKDLRDAFVDPESWAHQEPYLRGRKDSMDAPVFGYTVERIWNVLMQCNDMDVAWKCASLISGRRAGGTIEDCQCFDPSAS